MAKFLTTIGNSFYIEQIIINAEKNLTLVTPYLSLSKNLIDRLADADREDIRITLIYGKNELSIKENKKIEALKNLELFFCENLHAKCYHNESSLIITSMNLYEFSERNNREMGILIEKSTDIEIYKETLKEIESIKNSSELKNSPKKNNLSDLIFLSEDKKTTQDFYYPSLYRVLKNKFNQYNVQYDNEDEIIIENFPFKGVALSVNGRIDFNFDDEAFYGYVKKNFSEKIRELSPGIRFYWNYSLNIYPERKFEIDVNKEGLNTIVLKYLKIIENTQEQITAANTEYH